MRAFCGHTRNHPERTYTHDSNSPECPRVFWLIPCRANMFASCTKQLSWHDCASLVPREMKWACICTGCVCFWLCSVVTVCDKMCCLRCVVGGRRCVTCCVVMTVQKRKTLAVITEKIPRENFSLQIEISSKNKSAPRISVIISSEMELSEWHGPQLSFSKFLV